MLVYKEQKIPFSHNKCSYPRGVVIITFDSYNSPSHSDTLILTMQQTNITLANLFLTMAELLRKEEANPFRVRAYQRAASTLARLDEDIEDIAQRGDMDTLAHIGKDLARKIQEYLDTGTIRAYEDLKSPLPTSTKQWLQLPGFSEPIVNDLYFRLGIRSLDDLEALASSHLLRTRPGIPATTEELLEAIRLLRASQSIN